MFLKAPLIVCPGNTITLGIRRGVNLTTPLFHYLWQILLKSLSHVSFQQFGGKMRKWVGLFCFTAKSAVLVIIRLIIFELRDSTREQKCADVATGCHRRNQICIHVNDGRNLLIRSFSNPSRLKVIVKPAECVVSCLHYLLYIRLPTWQVLLQQASNAINTNCLWRSVRFKFPQICPRYKSNLAYPLHHLRQYTNVINPLSPAVTISKFPNWALDINT